MADASCDVEMTEVSPRKHEALRRCSWAENDAHKLSEDDALGPPKAAPPSPAPGVGTLAARKPSGGSEHDSLADASYGAADAAEHGSRASKRAKPDGGGGKGGVAPDDGERAPRRAPRAASASAPVARAPARTGGAAEQRCAAPKAEATSYKKRLHQYLLPPALASSRRLRPRSVDIALEASVERIGCVTAEGDLVFASAAAAPEVAGTSAADVAEMLDEVYEFLAERRAAPDAAAPPPAEAAPVPTANAAPAEAAAPPPSAAAPVPTANAAPAEAAAPPPAATPASGATPKAAGTGAAADEVVTKQLSGKDFYRKEKRSEAKAAVERDHADASDKIKKALVEKELRAGWKALDDGAKAQWAADAPEVVTKQLESMDIALEASVERIGCVTAQDERRSARAPKPTAAKAEREAKAKEREAKAKEREAKAKEANSSIREGEWTPQERAYACRLLDLAEAGQLPGCADNVTRCACLVYALGRNGVRIGQWLKKRGLLEGYSLRCIFRRVGPCSGAALGRLVELRDAFHATLDKSVLAALLADAAKAGAVFVVASQDELADANKAEADAAAKAKAKADADADAAAKAKAKADAAAKAKALEDLATRAVAAQAAASEASAKADAATEVAEAAAKAAEPNAADLAALAEKAEAAAEKAEAVANEAVAAATRTPAGRKALVAAGGTVSTESKAARRFASWPSVRAKQHIKEEFGMFHAGDEPGLLLYDKCKLTGAGFDKDGQQRARLMPLESAGPERVKAVQVIRADAEAGFEELVSTSEIRKNLFDEVSSPEELARGGMHNVGTAFSGGKQPMNHAYCGPSGSFKGQQRGATAPSKEVQDACEALSTLPTNHRPNSKYPVDDPRGSFAMKHKLMRRVIVTPPPRAAGGDAASRTTHDLHRDNAPGTHPTEKRTVAVPTRCTTTVVIYARKCPDTGKLVRCGPVDVERVSGLRLNVKPADKEASIEICPQDLGVNSFDGVVNAEYMHGVIGAEDPDLTLWRVTFVYFDFALGQE